MPTREELYTALRNADKAGDVAAARRIAAYIKAMPTEQPKAEPKAEKEVGFLGKVGDATKNAGAGMIRGAGSIGATLLYPFDKAQDLYYGDRETTLSDLVTGKKRMSRNEERRAGIDAGLRDLVGADPDSLAYQGGKLLTEIGGTAGAGGLIANGARVAAPTLAASPRVAQVLEAISSGGMRAAPATNPLANLAARATGGAISGGVSAGLVDPEYAKTGAIVGGILPPAIQGAGKVGNRLMTMLSGPQTDPQLLAAVAAARQAGYVIPPTQAKPTLANRLLEGFSGKITTAQNASARNQSVTNDLARKAIGADDLSEAGIAQVRAKANQAYDALGQSPDFVADDVFIKALDDAGGNSSAMRENFPGLVNAEVDNLVAGLRERGTFGAQPTIEAIKQLRFEASANKAAQDPAKKALGKAQNKIASAFEDLIDRNLQASGNRQLLTDYREARKTLAKVYDVEKAINPASRSVEAGKLAAALKKGRPLTGELLEIAEFAGQFPKAAQSVERMGSLPQVSPLDFGALGTMSAVTANPMLMAGVLARPAARSAILSPLVQSRLMTPAGNPLARLALSPRAEQLLLRSAPAVTSDRP